MKVRRGARGTPLRRVALGCALAWLALVSAGCWDYTDIDQRFHVTAMGFDADPRGVRVSFHLGNPPPQGTPGGVRGGGGGPGAGGGGGGPSPQGAQGFLVLSEAGPSPLDAMDSITGRIDRVLEPDHTQVILLGHDLARQGVRPVLDFITREPRVPPSPPVLITATGTAEQALATPKQGTSSPGDYFLKLLTKTSVGTRWLEVPAFEAYRTLYDPLRALALPAVDPKSGRVVGIGVFRGDRLAGILGPEDAWSLTLLRQGVKPDETRGLTVTIPASASSGPPARPAKLALWLTRSSMRVEAVGALAVRISIRLTAQVGELSGGIRPDLRDPSTRGAAQRAIAETVRRRLTATLERLQRRAVDPTGLGLQVWTACGRCFPPSEYVRRFPSLRFAVQVEATIRSPGMIW
ncbi:Ger(x)C family spore germination C-terminal domain-containing protein [Carboxydochorda subterranea]|uniref:Ger(X)C family spore germination C-terminal domain-containing protein n=1 Tax=Carboxydichorda subterranea TaxID=3109565 RepID=A0ABZ1C1F7_9FIRM|nr:Ger(x)C family spore germination C-terminal domain-containing protein [Limnochorda sp. L945t]WRP18784.1 Ger(x)C family spore germination C-terminal domain-containing protein [Limnochorda sp. L945t]